MFAIPNQSSIPQAYTQFTDARDPTENELYIDAEGGSRLRPSGNRDRVVDCMEEFVKYTIIMRQHFDLFSDRYSERIELQRNLAKDNKDKDGRENLASERDAKSTEKSTSVNGIVINRL